jgi:N-acetylglucosamine kinase-like BadF-type ATPase
MDLYLGFDGGQSHSLAVLADGRGHILGAGLAGPSDHLGDPGGVERLERAVIGAVRAAFASAALPIQRLRGACFALSGALQDRGRKEEILARCVDADLWVLRHDAESALAGATMGRPGVVVIAGTGSVAYGEDGRGHALLVGGWGYLMGDEGSAYWIALQALSAATKGADGRGPETSLRQELPEAAGCVDLRALQRRLYAGRVARPEIAGLTEAVGRAAGLGDRVAQAILAQAGRELARHAVAVIRRLGSCGQPMPVALIGGVFEAGERVLAPFEEHLKGAIPRACVIEPAFSSGVGALLLAYREAGIPLSEGLLIALQNTHSILSRTLECSEPEPGGVGA